MSAIAGVLHLGTGGVAVCPPLVLTSLLSFGCCRLLNCLMGFSRSQPHPSSWSVGSVLSPSLLPWCLYHYISVLSYGNSIAILSLLLHSPPSEGPVALNLCGLLKFCHISTEVLTVGSLQGGEWLSRRGSSPKGLPSVSPLMSG